MLLLVLASALQAAETVTVTISPTTTTLYRNSTQQFTATVSGKDHRTTWSVVETGGGTVNSTGLYTAPATAGTYQVKVKSTAVPTSYALATVTVVPVVVTVSPTTATIPAGSTQQFSATVTGAIDTSVTWSVQESSGGTISNGGSGSPGLYQAPALPGTFHAVATSNADPSKSATATVTVTPMVTVSVTPASATVALGGTQAFTVAVGGTLNTAVNWTATGGSLSATTGSSVTWTAPAQSGTYSVRATSQADPSKSSAVAVNVPSTVVLNLSPLSATVPLEGGQSLVVTVTGTTNTGVNWAASGGTLSATTGSTVGWTPPNASGSYAVTATSQADAAKQATATLTVNSAVAVSLTPATVAVQVNATQAFTAGVTGSGNSGVTWFASGGTLSGTGATVTWTAPSTTGTYQVSATSQADTNRQATATITVTTTPPVNISVAPSMVSLTAGGTVAIAASITNSSNPSANWTATGGSLSSASGPASTWTAPQVAGTYTVTATAAADPARTATVSIRVTPAVCTPVN